MKKCIVCDKEIIPTVSSKRNRIYYKKYCSNKCGNYQKHIDNIDYYKNYNREKTIKKQSEKPFLECKYCNNSFQQTKEGRIFCSPKCTSQFHKKKNRFLWQKDRHCEWCDKTFLPNHFVQRFCSEQCSIYAYQKTTGCKNPGFRGTEMKCVICNNIFPATVPQAKYCSKKCRRKSDYLKNREQKMHHARIRRVRKKDIGGSFTLEQWEDLKQSVNHTCKVCGRSDVKLTVDHIIPISKWVEWAEINTPAYSGNDIENIQPLCLNCNIKKSVNIE